MREICPWSSSELPICGRRAREQYGRSARQLGHSIRVVRKTYHTAFCFRWKYRSAFPSSVSQLVDYLINGGQLSSTALWELWWSRAIPIEAGALLSSPECFSRSHWLFCSFSNCSSLAEQENPEAQVRVNLYRFTRVFLPLNPHILQVWQPLMGRWFIPFPFPKGRFYPRG